MSLKYVQTLTLYQAGAGNIIGATTVVLTSLTDIYGNAITTMTPFGAKGYITLEPDTTNEEAATFTGITANANGTVSLTGVSTVLGQSPYTETSGLARQHSGGTKVVITDNVAFWNTFANKNNAETIANKWTFPLATRPTMDSDADSATATDLVTVGQLSRQAISGAANAATTIKGIVQMATQTQTDNQTSTGSTGALLVSSPANQRSTKLSDWANDSGLTNAYAIAPGIAISAYIIGQTFTFTANHTNTGASTLNVSALGAKALLNYKGGALVAGDITSGMTITVIYDGTSMVMQTPVFNTPTIAQAAKFGGTGTDGALSISTGTTTIALGSASYFEKNYTSVAISGTANLAFSGANNATGTTVALKSSTGGWSMTSSSSAVIDLRNLGGGLGSGGNSAAQYTTGSTGGGASGAGGGSGGGQGGDGGYAGGQANTVGAGGRALQILPWARYVPAGGNGGSGASGLSNGGSGSGGGGGLGAGGLYIEVAGTYTFTTGTINGTGAVGGNGGATSGGAVGQGAGGGGGGAGANILVLATAIGTDTGTYTLTGGGGGSGASGNGGTNGAGGASGANGIAIRAVNNYYL